MQLVEYEITFNIPNNPNFQNNLMVTYFQPNIIQSKQFYPKHFVSSIIITKKNTFIPSKTNPKHENKTHQP